MTTDVGCMREVGFGFIISSGLRTEWSFVLKPLIAYMTSEVLDELAIFMCFGRHTCKVDVDVK